MNFLTDITGPPVVTRKPVWIGSATCILTTRGYVICNPAWFNMPELMLEASSLATGCGFCHGRLHLSSRNFPMYFPGSSPPMLLVSRRLVVMPWQGVPPENQALFRKVLPPGAVVPEPSADLLRSVLPWFEVYEERASLASA